MVDKSLSRGLADRVLDEMSGLARAYKQRCRAIFGAIPERRHAIRAVAHDLREAGEACCLTQVIAVHPKSRWAATCAFVPEVLPGAGTNARLVAFRTVRIYSHVGRIPMAHCEPETLLTVHEHAVERLFQRLNVMDAAAVRDEMHDAMLLSLPMLLASRRAGHRQVVLPTHSGAFLCSLGQEQGGLLAKTWIAEAEEPCRHSAPMRIARQFLASAGGEGGIGAEIGALPIAVSLSALPPPHALVTALEEIEWLREPYTPRLDPIGELWQKAREQQWAA